MSLYKGIKLNKNIVVNIPPRISITFINGPKVEINNAPENETFFVEFIDKATGKTIHSGEIRNGWWIAASYKYYIDWLIKINGVEYNMDFTGKRVYIALESKSLGDTLAWLPYVQEFKNKYNCEVICSTFLNELFIDSHPDIVFVMPGTVVPNLYAMYTIGWYYNQDGGMDGFRNPSDVKHQPLQKTASDILGITYKEIKPQLMLPPRNIKKQVCIGLHSTSQAKYWNNPTGWQEVVDYLRDQGYEVILLSREGDGYMGNKHPKGITQHPNGPIKDVIKTLRESAFFIGIGSGLSWLSWACNIPTVIISGFSEPYTETILDTIRISSPEGSCTGCFNKYMLDGGDWNWCPEHKGTVRQFECSRLITGRMVIDTLKNKFG